jgi:SAM-dependent methyltransferase
MNGFQVGQRSYPYFVHPYNRTWTNERIVEVPLTMEVVRRYQGKMILEFGNVLGHYESFQHDIVDKYETSAGVINEDVISFEPQAPYDLIVSISTLEHVGWDEYPRDSTKISRALAHLKKCLKPGGFLFMTVPLGYNPEHDEFLRKNPQLFDRMTFIKRQDVANHWSEAKAADSWGARYSDPFPAANVIAVLEWTRPLNLQ